MTTLSDEEKAQLRLLASRMWSGFRDVTGAHASASHCKQGRYMLDGSVLLDLSSSEYPGVYVLVPDDPGDEVTITGRGDHPSWSGPVFPIINGGKAVRVYDEDGPWWDRVRAMIERGHREIEVGDHVRHAARVREAEQAARARASDLTRAAEVTSWAEAERDRYRVALERIAGRDGHESDPWSRLVARNALNGGTDAS